MNGPRVQYGGCSFIPPAGFVIQEEASFGSSDTANTAESLHRKKAIICVTLTSTALHPDVQEFSESPEDMNPDAYPVSLTLNTFVTHLAGSALDYLRNTGAVLKKHFKAFRTDFCEEDTVGEFRAARAQCSYVTNFRIFQLHIAWLAGGLLVTATMTVPKSGVEKGWADLRSFVDSVIL